MISNTTIASHQDRPDSLEVTSRQATSWWKIIISQLAFREAGRFAVCSEVPRGPVDQFLPSFKPFIGAKYQWLLIPWKEQVFRTSRVWLLWKYGHFRVRKWKNVLWEWFRSRRKMNKIAPFPCQLHALHVAVCTPIVAVCVFLFFCNLLVFILLKKRNIYSIILLIKRRDETNELTN